MVRNMSDELVEVQINKNAGKEKYSGLCGFYIFLGETKMCPMDVYKEGEAKGMLELVADAKKSKKPEPNEIPKEEDKPEPEVDLDKEVKDVTDALLEGDLVKAGEETKDLISKVRNLGTKKGKK